MSNIKDILVLNEKAIAVLLPEGSGGYVIVKNTFRWKKDPLKFWWDQEKLPPGSWTILGMSDALTEEQWKKVVESKKERGGAFNSDVGHYQSTGWATYYKNYELSEPSICIPNTATESGFSLLKSKGIEVPHLILINNEMD